MSQSLITSFVDYFQQVLQINSGMTDNKENSQTQNLRSGELNLTSNDTVFHAIFIPRDNERANAEAEIHVYTEKSEALKVIKSHKTGRLKSFKTRSEAENFSRQGEETIEKIVTEKAIGKERASNFKCPTSQDLVRFRKLIEAEDLDAVRALIWENPRYLVSSGDTPQILKEGPRYNALHVAVKIVHAGIMCELLLNTIINPDFVKLLYGDVDQQRGQILLDLYLNTPDKGLNETPLHFAVKYGQTEAVKVLVSYSQCVKTLLNKYKQTPLEIICHRKYGDDEERKREIRALLEEQFYVPVLRSEDSTLQPIIGEPFSPASPPKLNVDPISPRVEVRAFAGPMSKTQAIEFRKKWKTPPRFHGTPTRLQLTPSRDKTPNNDSVDSVQFVKSPVQNLSLRLQDTEKGLERVGRVLADEYHVSWKEFWPFLEGFADLRCSEGLWKLEKFLEAKFKSHYTPIENQINSHSNNLKKFVNGEPLNDLTNLCDKLEACSLHVDEENKENFEDDDFHTPPSSPMLTDSSEDEEMELADEGSTTFIERNTPTKTDYAVFNAIPATVGPHDYPNIYRWKHEMQWIMKKNENGSRGTPGIRRKLRL